MPTVDRDLATTLTQELVRIPSVNPDLVPGAPGEAEVASYIAGKLRDWGLEVRVNGASPGRPNVIGILEGSGGGRTLLFNGHMDTVGTEGMSDPFSGELKEGKVYGRGAIDMKGSLAATLCATKAIVDSNAPLRGNVIFTYVADEEYASVGTAAVVAEIEAGRLPRPDAAVNTEPSGLRVGIGHKGFAWLAVDVAGTAAHGSRPDLGVDAIVQMGKVLVEIDRWQERLSAGRAHPLLGTGSVHASLIEGGRELSSYPDHCRLKLERRTVPPEDADTVLAELQAILEKLRTEDGDFRATSELLLVRNPFEADPWSDIVETVSEALARVTGEPAVTMTHTGWLDSALLGDAGIPTVICGPIGEGLHALVEWADSASLGTCAQLYADVIEEFCA